VGTIKAQIPRSERAITIMTSAVPPLVAQAFVPDSTQRSPSRTARVHSAAASEPDSGSDSAKPASISPRAIDFNQRSFCAALP